MITNYIPLAVQKLTHYLLVTSAENLCKLFDTLVVSLNFFSKNLILKKIFRLQKSLKILPGVAGGGGGAKS